MLYDVEKISELTKLSKVTIYKKLKLKEIKQYIVRKQGKAYVDEEGFKLIKQGLNYDDKLNEELNDIDIESDETAFTVTDKEDLIKVKNDLIDSLNEQVFFLREQLGVKDIQLDSKDKLLENMQILVKDSQRKQENDIPMLEAHFEELDEKIGNIKKQMDERKENLESDKGFFRFFKRTK
ncbi:hypothetical protein [Clostridium lacusfryxellense]|uniref:hypothetical protein n=1 Tax=Clostridium lacusfryxellense TaxID=205328 RepID=UPI001C0CA001|nr:hypothetical protein [Clostridium lacusfryxellense]MBU3114780.1 hypothetical protein [Clostridium lacusfryxellense]